MNYVEPPSCGRFACFGWRDGKCTILVDNDFKGKPCPFFKRERELGKWDTSQPSCSE